MRRNTMNLPSSATPIKKAPQKKKAVQKNHIEKNVNDVVANDLLGVTKALKKSPITSIRLYQKLGDLENRRAENRKLGFLGYRHSETLFTFSKTIAWAISGGGWLQELELGFALWERDLKILAESLRQTTTLKKLSFANSELGDHGLQILGKSIQECAQLEVLNLSSCTLSDAVAPLLSSILKAHLCRKAQSDWQASLRSSKGVNALTMRPKGLTALDVSFNHLSDISVQTICTVLKTGTPLEAMNLRGNQLTRGSGKLLLDVMEEWAVLRYIDLRDNTDNKLMGVLEDRQHLTTFSRPHPPFWLHSSSLKSRRGSSHKPRGTSNSPPISKTPTRPHSAGAVPQPRSRSLLITPRRDSPVLKKKIKRPSTSPGKVLHSGRKSNSSSCSNSEFAAWDDHLNTKENKLPHQTSKENRLESTDVSMSDEESDWKEAPSRKPIESSKQKVSVSLNENSSVLRARSSDNLNTRDTDYQKYSTRVEASKPASRKSKDLNAQMDSRYDADENSIISAETQQKPKQKSRSDSKKSSTKVPTTEWSSFLKEITHAILHLQERLDELIGPADPESLAEHTKTELKLFT